MKTSKQGGAAHVFLLIGILVVALVAVVAVMVFKPDLNGMKKQVTDFSRNLLTQIRVSPTPTPSSDLEAELNSVTLTDPSEDFESVDRDISTL